jgi:uncharacterized protein (UPF0254 family)
MSPIEMAAQAAEAYNAEADKKFADIIKRGRQGKQNLQLAAAAAAGMSHAARNIALRIRALGEKK